MTEKGGAVAGAMELAERIAKNAPLSVSASKAMVRGTVGMSEEEAWEYQKPLMAKVFTSDDAKEGPRALRREARPELDRPMTPMSPTEYLPSIEYVAAHSGSSRTRLTPRTRMGAR